MAIIERGAKVQAGSVLRELSVAYKYAIGLEKLPDTFICTSSRIFKNVEAVELRGLMTCISMSGSARIGCKYGGTIWQYFDDNN